MEAEKPQEGQDKNKDEDVFDLPELPAIGSECIEDFPDLGFNKMSSIAHPEVPTLPVVTEDVHQVTMSTKEERRYLNEYEVLETLGEGSYGKVKKVERTYQDEQGKNCKGYYAMKIYSRKALQSSRFFGPDGNIINGTAVLENQLNIMKTLDHKNISRCYQIINDHHHDKLYVVMEYCDLGQLMDWSDSKRTYQHNEKALAFLQKQYQIQDVIALAKIIFKQLCEAIDYMHSRNISNRDIKVDNILVKSQSFGKQIKITDFSTARYSPKDLSYQPAGTPGFKAPQHQTASSQGYSPKACDIWSLGITLYVFCFGKLPFPADEFEIEVEEKDYAFVFPENTPVELQQTITKMCTRQWQKRPTIKEVMDLAWFH